VVNINKELKESILYVRLSGSIEESVNFDELVGPPPGEMVVNTKEVPRINSVGVKAWIKYFQSCQTKGTRLRFEECSTAIVEQVNLISNFVCSSCHSELVGLFRAEDLVKMKFVMPELNCSKCGEKAIFDDIPEEFFGFLMK
jgi:anti-anti-sigma regulatory factor